MNYIFLDIVDIDGVLNCKEYIIKHKEKIASIDESRLKLLSDFCNEYNCLVVLSSSWRSTLKDDLTPKQDYVKYYDGSIEISRGKYMCDLFKTYNIPLVGKTPIYGQHENRAEEILDYINKHFTFPTDKFVIFDDEDDSFSKYFPYNTVLTDFYGEGLTEKEINEAKLIFER